jgi:hypothetical protein
MRRACLALTLALVLLAPASAGGDVGEPHTNAAPASYVHADALMRAAIAQGARRWDSYPVKPECPTEVYVYDAGSDKYMQAEIPEPDHAPACKVWVNRSWRDGVWAMVNDRAFTRAERRAELAHVCDIAEHEEGHRRAVPHSPNPFDVMFTDPVIGPSSTACLAWAAKVMPDRPTAKRVKKRAGCAKRKTPRRVCGRKHTFDSAR